MNIIIFIKVLNLDNSNLFCQKCFEEQKMNEKESLEFTQNLFQNIKSNFFQNYTLNDLNKIPRG